MSYRFLHSPPDDAPIVIPAIGLRLWVRVPPEASTGAMSIIETENAPGFGPPLHRHRETEIFRVLEGKYLYEIDGRRLEANTGDVVIVPGSAPHAFRNITDRPARQFVVITPALDAVGFFTSFADLLRDGPPDPDALAAMGKRWDVEFLGPPLRG
jgi:quercetin dioxygenase-like cupin family protein